MNTTTSTDTPPRERAEEPSPALVAYRKRLRKAFEIKTQIAMLDRPIPGMNRAQRRAAKKRLRKSLRTLTGVK